MKKVLIYTLFFFLGLQMNAQVKDISLTITPTANYTWWDKQVSVKNGPMVGGMLGFGLGRYIELRGVYEQSLDLKNTLENLNAPDNIVDKFTERKVDITRWGGEFKGNIPMGSGLAPYLTLGSGVQKFKIKDLKNEQIYLSAGLGTKISLNSRITLNLEGKCHAFNLDQGSLLRVNNPNNDNFNEWIDKNITDERMINWSVNAGLQIYLGGRNPNAYTALDRAYERQFSSGFSGIRFVLEPGGAYINFDDDSNLRNTYLLGGAVGIDFTDFVGLRAFYYQATKDEKVSIDWDNLAIYGGDFLAKLNVARGIVPYVTIGGGYLNAYDSYMGNTATLPAKSGYFAKGGLGLTIPLAQYFEIFGAANMLLTTDKENKADIQSTDELKQHIMYNAGLKINIGGSTNARRELDSYVQHSVNEKTMMYEQRIEELRDELNRAYEANDSLKIARVMKEKQRIEKEMKLVKQTAAIEQHHPTTITESPQINHYQGMESVVRLSPEELESLVDKVLTGVEQQQNRKETTEERIDRLERLLLQSNHSVYPQQNYVPQNSQSSNKDLLNELQRINTKIDTNSQKIDNALLNQHKSSEGDKTVIVSPGTQQTPIINTTKPVVEKTSADGGIYLMKENKTSKNVLADNVQSGRVASWILYKGLSPFAGFTLGEKAAGIFGIKANYGLSSNDFVFTPDLYFGIGSETAYGFNANVIYPILAVNGFSPYIGTGLGLNKIDKFNFGINFIIGSHLNVGNGSLFVDYTSRRFFKNNQFAVGYRFDL